MYHSDRALERIAKDKMRDFQREAAVERQLPSYRQRLAAALISIARWLEPEVESAPAPKPLSR